MRPEPAVGPASSPFAPPGTPDDPGSTLPRPVAAPQPAAVPAAPAPLGRVAAPASASSAPSASAASSAPAAPAAPWAPPSSIPSRPTYGPTGFDHRPGSALPGADLPAAGTASPRTDLPAYVAPAPAGYGATVAPLAPVAPVAPVAAPLPRWQAPSAPGMPTAPPLYDPTAAGGFGAAGGVPLLPDPSVAAPVAAPRGTSMRAAIVVGIVSAIVASLITGGLFVAFSNRSGTSSSAASGSAGTLVPGLDIYALLDRAQPSVVSIRTDTKSGSTTEPLGAGSGVIISADGLILTNAHVVAGASSMKAGLFDGSTHTATLVGSFPDADIALVKIKDPVELVPADLGSSADIKVGDPVVAIGNALNLGAAPSVTEGIVSAKDRDIQTREGVLKNLIQTDAAINPGNSGGPLIDASGRVVGINTAIINNAQNIGFAISIDEIKPLIEDLKDGKGTVTPDSAFLGVSTSSVADVTEAVRNRYRVTAESGAFVSDVVPDSAADAGGLQPGDVVTSIDGKSVASSADVGAVIRSKKSGDQVVIEYEREGEPRQTTVTLTSRAESGG